MANLPCENGGGSLNNPANVNNNSALKPYVAPALPLGNWQITSLDPDTCAINEQLNQQTYVAETLNISGAPINIYKLLGIHEQGSGSIVARGRIIGSAPFPGYPLTGINGAAPWRSLATGSQVIMSGAYVGVDFGIKTLTLDNQQTEYDPQEPKLTTVGAISLTQSNVPGFYAQQVRVDTADGSVTIGTPAFSGVGTGTISGLSAGTNAALGVVMLTALTSTTFNALAMLPDNSVIGLGVATVGVPFYSTILGLTITAGATPFVAGDTFTISIDYNWRRAGLFNVTQSPSPQLLSLEAPLLVKAIRVTPTMFTGAGNWEVSALDVLDSVPADDINGVQDLFFNENRDREYATTPLVLKAQYSPADSTSDLAKFGLNILDQYVFTVSFATMVQTLGRPIVVGDILDVTPELQWDQNLLPVRKFLEVMDAGWSSAGFGPQYNPTVYRFSAQQALPSQETRDIFGTLDTQKYLIPDSILDDGLSPILNTAPLTTTEEIGKAARDAVPEVGSDDLRSID